MEVSIREAKNSLSKYGNLANAGQKITICKNGKPWFDLVPHVEKKRSIQPFVEGRKGVSAQEAVAPVDSSDIEGWI